VRFHAVCVATAAATMSLGAPGIRASLVGTLVRTDASSVRPLQERCTPVVLSTRPLALPDGTLISIDVKSAATDGHALLIVGPNTYLWAPRTAGGAPPVRRAPAVGVLRDSLSRISLVPAPHSPSGAEFHVLRVASAGRGTWHFLLLAGLGRDTLVQRFGTVDSASIWYGLFDGRRWRQLTQIGVARDAGLVPERSSGLIATRHGLAFAYSYDRSRTLNSNAPGNQGLVLLTREGDDWKSDTLPTWDGPGSVQLTSETDGGVLAVFNQDYFENHRLHYDALFLAAHDAVWHRPRIVWEPSEPGYVNYPLGIARVRDSQHALRTILSWEEGLAGKQSMDSLAWGVLDTDGTIHHVSRSIKARDFNSTSLSLMRDGGAIWITPSDTARDELRVIYARDTIVEVLATVHVPSFSPTPVAVTLADGTLLVATMSIRFVEQTGKPQSATTYLTELAVRCEAQRR